MKAPKYSAPAVLLLLAACGGGGGGNDPPAAPPPVAQTPAPAPAAPTPAPAPVPAPTPIAVPAPVTPPISQAPAPVPPSAGSPASPPPAPPPQPAPGTYILGKFVRAAMQSNPGQTEYLAYETDDDTGKPNPDKLAVYVGYYQGATIYYHYSYPVWSRTTETSYMRYPLAQMQFAVNFTNEGHYALGRQMEAYVNGTTRALIRPEGDFAIKDDDKFLLDTTAAQWTGVEGKPWFVQFQIASYSKTNTVFALCLHESVEELRRRSCTLHNKDTGEYKGTWVVDDSKNLGAKRYEPLN